MTTIHFPVWLIRSTAWVCQGEMLGSIIHSASCLFTSVAINCLSGELWLRSYHHWQDEQEDEESKQKSELIYTHLNEVFHHWNLHGYSDVLSKDDIGTQIRQLHIIVLTSLQFYIHHTVDRNTWICVWKCSLGIREWQRKLSELPMSIFDPLPI